MDRSIAKILCLPFFDDAFKASLRDLKIDRVEFWMALEDESDDSPAQKIANVLPALTSSQEISDKILARSDMINTLATLVTSSATRVRDEIAVDLGYGSAETFLPSGKRALSISQPTAPTPAQVGGRPGGLGPQAEVSSLQAAEAAERKKWGQRLQAIADRAGSAAGINDPARSAGLSHDEVTKLRTMAFEAEGFRTIRQNVRYWERFEEWAIARGAMIRQLSWGSLATVLSSRRTDVGHRSCQRSSMQSDGSVKSWSWPLRIWTCKILSLRPLWTKFTSQGEKN